VSGLALALAAGVIASAPPSNGAPDPQPPPPVWSGVYEADATQGDAVMAAAREMMRQEMGGQILSGGALDLAEYQAGSGGGYRWEGEAWVGGDLDRFVLHSEGEGASRFGLQTGEVDGFYSRAIGPYADLQLGVRQDLAPVGRTSLAAQIETLAPYGVALTGGIYISTLGEVLGRLEASTAWFVTQRLELRPRVELNFAAQNSPATLTGRGLSDAELGLRLLYDIRRAFAPYVGVSWDRRVGAAAADWRARGWSPNETTIVTGLAAFF
jgi:copper resistance protein B